mmetsp:Transcript_10743/g.16208  ORF Transcript_10743/g.16208 Transcript_10743/m.16208 type:complete len:306 (+) Transcript_10743:84-1001(+)
MRDKNKMEEDHLKNLIHTLKNDHEMNDKDKSMRLRDMSKALDKMKKSHTRHEDEMKLYIKDMAKDSYNPVMKERHSFRKDNFFHHHNNNRDSQHIPVWTAIHEINRQLHDFCQHTDQVAFYDPTSLFTSRTEKGEYRLLTDYISPRGHPTQWGYKLWLNEIQQKVIDWKIKAEDEARGDYSDIVESSEDDWEASSFIINHHYYGEDMDKSDETGSDTEVEGEEEEEEEEEDSQEHQVAGGYELSELPPSDDDYYYESEEELELDRFGNIIEKGTKDMTSSNEEESKNVFDFKDIKAVSEQLDTIT